MPIDTPKEALKKAVKSMKTTLTNLNPNKAAVKAKNKKARIKQAKKGINFINWLDKKENLSEGLKNLNSQYAYRYELVKKSAAEYIKQGNLEKDLKYYGFSIADLLK
jgi:ribosomal protein L29